MAPQNGPGVSLYAEKKKCCGPRTLETLRKWSSLRSGLRCGPGAPEGAAKEKKLAAYHCCGVGQHLSELGIAPLSSRRYGIEGACSHPTKYSRTAHRESFTAEQSAPSPRLQAPRAHRS